MRAIKSNNRMKQLMITISMLLFLFTASNLYSQQVAGVGPTDKADNSSEGASVNTLPASQLGYEVLQSSPVKYDRNTLLSYSIPWEMDVEIKMYDNAGMELKTLVSEMQNAGTHKINLNSADLKDGIYFYQLTIGTYSETKKIMLVN